MANNLPCPGGNPGPRNANFCFAGLASIASPNPWSGNGDPADGPLDFPYSKYYIVVTVTATDCAIFSQAFIWNTTNDKMNIEVPTDLQYLITVEYREQCKNFWNDTPSGRSARGVWISPSKTFNNGPVNYFVDSWTYARKDLC